MANSLLLFEFFEPANKRATTDRQADTHTDGILFFSVALSDVCVDDQLHNQAAVYYGRRAVETREQPVVGADQPACLCSGTGLGWPATVQQRVAGARCAHIQWRGRVDSTCCADLEASVRPVRQRPQSSPSLPRSSPLPVVALAVSDFISCTCVCATVCLQAQVSLVCPFVQQILTARFALVVGQCE